MFVAMVSRRSGITAPAIKFLLQLLVPPIATAALSSAPEGSTLTIGCQYLLVFLDIAACALLLGFGGWHVSLVLRNRTSLSPAGEEAYDVGWSANWRQWMGSCVWLWPLPVWRGDAPAFDGLHPPKRPQSSI